MARRARLSRPAPAQQDWQWHKVDSAAVSVSVLMQGDRRMEAENYLGDGYGTRLALEARPSGWTCLHQLATTTMPGRLKAVLVSSSVGTPYVAATQVFDARPVPRRWVAVEQMTAPEAFRVRSGQILMTRSGNVGRSTLATLVHEDLIVSDDLLRIDPIDQSWHGWVYGYLRAPTVRRMLKASQYGHIIKHLETGHLAAMPVPLLRAEYRARFTHLTESVIAKRSEAHAHDTRAEAALTEAIGKPSLEASETFVRPSASLWGRNLRLEAARYNPAADAADDAVRRAGHDIVPLGKIMERIFVPPRFKHVYGDEGVAYLDSAQLVEVAPDIEKRILSLDDERQLGYTVSAGILLIPCSGQLHGIIGSVVIADAWHEGKILNNHVMRLIPSKESGFRLGYLRTVLGHPTLGRPRILRYAFGSSVPELLPADIGDIAIPRLESALEDSIADDAEAAARLRSEADQIEDEMQTLSEHYVQEFLRGHDQYFESSND